MRVMTEVIDSQAFSELCTVDSSNQIPDGDTIGRFCNKLVENIIQKKLFSQVVELLRKKDLILKKGTTWHFGYKAHIGVDSKTGLVHTVKVTTANVHDIKVIPDLLTREETYVYGDS